MNLFASPKLTYVNLFAREDHLTKNLGSQSEDVRGECPPCPLVSIVINNFNYANFLRRAIDSALQQSYKRVEVIVVDDGSTDDSASIIESYNNECIAVLRPNGGQAAAYNSGFAASHGDIVLFLDADDMLRENAAEAVVAAWAPGTAKVQFRLDVVDDEDRLLGHSFPNLPFVHGDVLPLLGAYGYYPSPPGSGNAFARAVLELLLPAPEGTWKIGVDGYLIALAALYGRVVSIDESLGFYRHHPNSHSGAINMTLPKLRRNMLNEIDREAAIMHHAEALSRPIDGPLVLRIPAHCKARLLSLRLDPDRHPVPGDKTTGLLWSGLIACWRFPHYRPAKRLFAMAAFPLLSVLPRSWLARMLDPIFIARRRRFVISFSRTSRPKHKISAAGIGGADLKSARDLRLRELFARRS